MLRWREIPAEARSFFSIGTILRCFVGVRVYSSVFLHFWPLNSTSSLRCHRRGRLAETVWAFAVLDPVICRQTLDQANRVVIVEHHGPGRLLIEQRNQVCYGVGYTAPFPESSSGFHRIGTPTQPVVKRAIACDTRHDEVETQKDEHAAC